MLVKCSGCYLWTRQLREGAAVLTGITYGSAEQQWSLPPPCLPNTFAKANIISPRTPRMYSIECHSHDPCFKPYLMTHSLFP